MAAGDEGPAPKPGSTTIDRDVETLWSALSHVPWEVSDEPRGSAAWRCEKNSKVGRFELPAQDEWCFECHTAVPQERIRFYAFGIDRAPACRLGEFEVWLEGDDDDERREIHRRLAQRLTKAYGQGRYEGGAGWRRDVWRWRPSGREIMLYLAGGDGAGHQPRVVLLARAPFLRKQMDEDRLLERDVKGEWGRFLRGRMDRELVARLQPLFPHIEQWLSPPPLFEVGKVPPGLRPLLVRAQRSSGELRAALLLAADSRALHHYPEHVGASDPKPEDSIRTLAFGGYRLTYQFLHGDGWTYAHELLGRVYRNHPKTRWGEWAFTLLLAAGWSPSACEGVHEVIPRAEAFLRTAAPANPRRPDVLFLLSRAYETWWSVGQDDDERAKGYQQGAEAARARAVELYEQVLREVPASSPAALYARRQLPRLLLKRDSGARAFYCSMH